MTITVLVADDHAIVRDGLRALLEAQPDIVVIGAASNGREAVRQATTLHPNVVVIDIAMPDLNGIEAAAQIRLSSPETKVLILSMHATSEHIYRALQAGVHGYLLKATVGREVIEAVRTVHDKRRYFSLDITDLILDDYVAYRETPGAGSPLQRLTDREREVLQLVVEGKTSAEIAAVLALSPKTVNTYRSRLMAKLGIADLPGLVRFAIQHGLTPLE